MQRSMLSLFVFLCVFILLAVAEKDGVSLQGSHFKSKLMTLEPATSPKNLLNKLKIAKEVLNSQSKHTRMFVCTKLQLHLIQWLRLNFTSARLILTARHCFRLQTKLPPKIWTLQAPNTGTEMSLLEKIP